MTAFVESVASLALNVSTSVTMADLDHLSDIVRGERDRAIADLEGRPLPWTRFDVDPVQMTVMFAEVTKHGIWIASLIEEWLTVQELVAGLVRFLEGKLEEAKWKQLQNNAAVRVRLATNTGSWEERAALLNMNVQDEYLSYKKAMNAANSIVGALSILKARERQCYNLTMASTTLASLIKLSQRLEM